MPMQKGAAARWKADAVATQKKVARWQGRELRGQLFARAYAGRRHRRPRRREVESPTGRTRLAGVKRHRALAVPGFAIAQAPIRDRHGTVHHENHARRWRQRQRGLVRQDILMECKHGGHATSPFGGGMTIVETGNSTTMVRADNVRRK